MIPALLGAAGAR